MPNDSPISVVEPVDVTAIDLFCGAGGLAYGLKTAGLNVAAGVDLDPACGYPLETNTGAVFQKRDVTDLRPEELVEWFGGASRRVLAGCAPCQPFSTYSQSRKTEDDRWTLLREFKRLALAVQPDVVTMENVAGLGKQDVWREFTEALEGDGYHVRAWEVNCADFGVPQSRKRLVMLASRLGPIELNKPASTDVSVHKAIGHLSPIPAGTSAVDDPMHSASVLTPRNLERIVASRPGGTWRDWPVELRAECHRRPSGKTYPSVYGRMEWSKPSPTITTQCYGFGNGRFGHPDQDRAISLREAALLQSFPTEYAFLEPGKRVNFSQLGTLIGNAVPPKLGEAIGLCIREHLSDHDSTAALH